MVEEGKEKKVEAEAASKVVEINDSGNEAILCRLDSSHCQIIETLG